MKTAIKCVFQDKEEVIMKFLYDQLTNRALPFVNYKETSFEDFRNAIIFEDSDIVESKIKWECQTKEVYYICTKLMEYIDGITYNCFGSFGLSKRGTRLVNLKISRSKFNEAPLKHQYDIDSIFTDLNNFISISKDNKAIEDIAIKLASGIDFSNRQKYSKTYSNENYASDIYDLAVAINNEFENRRMITK